MFLKSWLENAGLDRAYGWLLRSGIREANGGVARYYRSDLEKNAPVSTEITGYAVSALVHLHPFVSPDITSLEPAVESARYLAREAWSDCDATFPFELGSKFAYFFDIGIIVRGLLAAYSATRDPEFAQRAKDAGLSLAFDFLGDGVFHPVITLPEKQPLDYEPKRWSRSPGCYQLKSALAWKDIGDAFGDEHAAKMFEMALSVAMSQYEDFLPGVDEPEKVMDRLHAYCYFLEALLSVGDRPACRVVLEQGIQRVSNYLLEISPKFERSDVCAQLLRVRLIAHHALGLALDEQAADDEARRAASYQGKSEDVRIDGGFWFGRKGQEMLPFVNPVSTAFCAQALLLWQQHREVRWSFDLKQLI
jgi:hypothetical protein